MSKTTAEKIRALAPKQKEYLDFVDAVGFGKVEGVDVTHDGYPLSVKEAKFINMFLVDGNVNKCLRESGLGSMRNLAGKDYLINEIQYRLSEIKKATVADADEIMQYFSSVMRGEIKDQFGLDAPLSERTNAARELAKRIIDPFVLTDTETPEVKITLNFEGI